MVCICIDRKRTGVSLALMVKNLAAIQETWIQSLGQEDPLEEKMATHSSILAWRIPWTEEPGRLQSIWSQRVANERPGKHACVGLGGGGQGGGRGVSSLLGEM